MKARSPYVMGSKADQRGIDCPLCGSTSSTVTDSRSHGGTRFRTRLCRCGTQFSTVEKRIAGTAYDTIVNGKTYEIIK